ncbi:MAG: helix-turn-helix domain-containing protein [Anaerolineae bacterium]|nr:helix-turn-helix domain-containing protein [Anaerolineae bacterium]
MNKIELLLHPVRMRIILVVANRVLTTQQLAGLLADIPQTTLYRQINLLLEGGILQVVRESKIRGTVERELTLVEGAARIDRADAAALPAAQQEEFFAMFIAALLADFKRAQPPEGMPAAIYQRQRLWMTPETMQAVNQQIDALLAAYKTPPPQADESGARPWLFTGIIMPDA